MVPENWKFPHNFYAGIQSVMDSVQFEQFKAEHTGGADCIILDALDERHTKNNYDIIRYIVSSASSFPLL